MATRTATPTTLSGDITGYMPLHFWDSYFKLLFERLEVSYPHWTHKTKTNQAIYELELMVCEYEAEMSLAAWLEVLKKRATEINKKREPPGRLRKLLGKVKARVSWRRVFDF